LAEEGGPRIGEICRIKVSDVDLERRRILIGLPNKTMTERFVRFHDKTAKFLKLWLAERDPSVRHDYLLHRPNGRPYNNLSLHYAIAKVVCKTVLHKKVNEDGLDVWSTHRLRHVMASRLVSNGADAATVMSMGGWTTGGAMAGYAQVQDHVADRGYHEAMARAAERKQQPQTKHSSFTKYVGRSPEHRP
jgi:integrase